MLKLLQGIYLTKGSGGNTIAIVTQPVLLQSHNLTGGPVLRFVHDAISACMPMGSQKVCKIILVARAHCT